MQAHRTRATVTEDHEIKVALPPDFPAGEAEVFNSWLDGTLRRLPLAPSPPLEALRRENLYEDE